MVVKAITREWQIGNRQIQLAMPDPQALRQAWQAQRLTTFPYWGQCWPASIALANFLEQEPQWIKGKTVMEIAAGLALPSLLAATLAKTVLATDYLQEPLQYINQSKLLNGTTNLQTGILNWQHPLPPVQHDVVLLSDVNYDPDAFEALSKLMHHYLNYGTTLLLSTPQRLVGASFIQAWVPYQLHASTINITTDNVGTTCSVWVLGKP